MDTQLVTLVPGTVSATPGALALAAVVASASGLVFLSTIRGYRPTAGG